MVLLKRSYLICGKGGRPKERQVSGTPTFWCFIGRFSPLRFYLLLGHVPQSVECLRLFEENSELPCAIHTCEPSRLGGLKV